MAADTIVENIIQRQGVWYFRAQIEGRDVRKSLFTKDQAEARIRAAYLAGKVYGEDLSTLSSRRLISALMERGDPHMFGFVYFIQAVSGGPVKIGMARNVKHRRANLQVGSGAKLRIVATLPGSPGAEATLHKKFASHRIHGEWFRPSSKIRRFIEAVVRTTEGTAATVRRLPFAEDAERAEA